jgi:DNA invertase Pin-like site-specific DNA recombinase/transposase
MNVSEIVKPHHIARKAFVYIRQSTEIQVKKNVASPLYQKAQADYALRYGWQPTQIEIIEDLGLSGTSITKREGYQKILHEISDGKVGGVFVHDISRLNRNSLDFQFLLAKCRECDVLVFEDGRPFDPHDGLDSFMATIRAEVAQLENADRRKKMVDGRKARVRAGFAVTAPPVGYVRLKKGYWSKHPDENVRRVIEVIFQKAQRLPSIYSIWQYLREKSLLVPVKSDTYFKDHRVKWKEATYAYVGKILGNVHYTGDYCFGREVVNRRLALPAEGLPKKRRPGRLKGEGDLVLVINDHHESYVEREIFQRLREKFEKNRFGRFQPVREGKNLLQGAAVCGHCGRRMASNYSSNPNGLAYYTCMNKFKGCEVYARMIRSEQVDRQVEEALFRVISKSNVDAILERYEAERREAFYSRDESELRMKQAMDAAQRAEDAYKTVDPSNDLVRAKLEQEWQERLRVLGELESAAETSPGPPPPLTKKEKERLSFLCENFSKAFRHPAVDMTTRKRLVRCLIAKAIITLRGNLILVALHWSGEHGSITTLTIQTPRYVQAYILEKYQEGLDEEGILEAMRRDGIGVRAKVYTQSSISRYLHDRGVKSCRTRKREEIYRAVEEYRAQGLNAAQIADRLNADGLMPLSCDKFSRSTVLNILFRLDSRPKRRKEQGPHNWETIYRMLGEDLPTNEIVSRLNASGLTTAKGLLYTHDRLSKVIRRQGYEAASPEWSVLTRDVKNRLLAMHSEGFGYREAYEILREGECIDSSPNTRNTVISYYRYITAIGAESSKVPREFIAAVDELIDRGLTARQMATELNRQNLRPLRGEHYNSDIVARYCRILGISLRAPNYASNPRLVEHVNKLHADGKSCREIAKALNQAGFRTYSGRGFDYKAILDLLKVLGNVPHRKSRSREITDTIRSLDAQGYHSRTITRKLNSMGKKTVTAKKFREAHVRHDLRELRKQGRRSAQDVPDRATGMNLSPPHESSEQARKGFTAAGQISLISERCAPPLQPCN